MPNSSGKAPFQAADTAGIRQKFEAEMNRSIASIAPLIDEGLGVDAAQTCLRQYLSNPGKRLRPLLLLGTVQALCPDRTIDAGLLRMACGLEFFHEFILIHDDLIDRGETRRGAPTLWCRLESDAGLPVSTARAIALILGDVLFAHATGCFGPDDATAEIYLKTLSPFLRIAGDTGWGAIGELIASNRSFTNTKARTIEAIYHAKTTRYTFEAPMSLAAGICDAPDAVRATLIGMARPLGLAFQLENDLHELTGLLDGASGISADLQAGLRTLPLVRLVESLPEGRGEDVAALLDHPDSPRRRERLAAVMERVGLVSIIRSEIERLFEASGAILDRADLDADLRKRLESVGTFLRSNRRHSEA